MSVKTADVIVIGAGIVGNAAMYYLAKQGINAICLEETMIGHCSSSRNGGATRQSGRDPREIEIAIYATKHIWPTLSEELGVDVEWRQDGYLYCGYNEEHRDLILKRIQVAKQFGLEMVLYQGDDIRRINPYVSDHVKYAGWTPKDAVANPLTSTLGYYKRARELGGKFYTGEKVVRLETKQGYIRRVITQRGNIYEADAVILAAGYFSRKIINTLGVDFPLYKRLVEVIVTEQAPPMFNMMVGAASGFYGFQTAHGSFVFSNNTNREMTMADMIRYPRSSSVSAANISLSAVTDLPSLGSLKVVRNWSGWTDQSPDVVPTIGAVDEIPGLYVSFGASGHGFCPGPAVGYILSEMTQGRPSPVDLSGLRFDRFDYCNPSDDYSGGSVQEGCTGKEGAAAGFGLLQ